MSIPVQIVRRKYTGFSEIFSSSELVFEISLLPKHLEIKVEIISGSPAHADYDSVQLGLRYRLKSVEGDVSLNSLKTNLFDFKKFSSRPYGDSK